MDGGGNGDHADEYGDGAAPGPVAQGGNLLTVAADMLGHLFPQAGSVLRDFLT